MRRILKFAFLAGIVGAACSLYQAWSRDETVDQMMGRAAKVGAEAAAAGATVGVLFGFRASRRRKKQARQAAALAARQPQRT
ncbi:MAG TPA: hypothetical protein VK975_06125, partial [Acidimicrobiales bacterium]|nr:hypothetical protein [Acidimicrobiales bacterium]